MGRDSTTKKSIANILIAYANGSFREDPNNIEKLFEVIDQHLPLTFAKPRIEVETIQGLIGPNGQNYLAKLKENTEECNRLKEQKVGLFGIPASIALNSQTAKVAIDAVYGYEDGKCTACNYHRTLPKNYSYDGLQRVNCLECVQIYFIQILDSFVKVPEFYQLYQFNRYLNDCGAALNIRTVHHVFLAEIEKKKGKRIGVGFGYLYDHPVFGETINEELLEKTKATTPFNDFIIDIMYFCLFKFLEHHDREFIGRCKKCNRFFVRKRLSDREINCPECKGADYRSPEQHKQRQAESRKRLKEAAIRAKKLEAINKYRDKGYTKKEAEKLWEDDNM